MRISFMTLGCPDWDLPTICRRGREYGFDGVDFRGLLDSVDVTMLPAFRQNIAETRRMLDDAGLMTSCISSSICVCDPAKRDANLDESKRTIDICRALDCGIVRVFGNGPVPEIGHAKAAAIGRDMISTILELDGARDLKWVFETHDHWIRSYDCRRLLDGITEAAFGALWDTAHTSRVGNETPQQTWDAIGDRVGYVHVKDARYDPGHEHAMQDGWRYVPVGTGDLPISEAIATLKAGGYTGWLQFEHEKRWHRNLPEPEVVFPLFVQWIHPLID